MRDGELQTLVVFDFDDTLIHGDSMWTFFALVAGWPKTVVTFLVAFASYHFKKMQKDAELQRVDRGTFLKTHMLHGLIRGQKVETLGLRATQLRSKLRWDEAMVSILKDHYDKGHRVVIASGSIDLYLPELIKDLPHHDLLCTDIEIYNGIATGDMFKGNCVRKGKAERVETYIKEHGPFGESWGYGNFPDDMPMLKLLKNRVVV